MQYTPTGFTETLQQAQRDLYYIDALLFQQMHALEKHAKKRKIQWRIISMAEHTVGITFGILAIKDFYNQRYGMGIVNTTLMGISAPCGFNATKMANIYSDGIQKIREMRTCVQDLIEGSNPDQLHAIAEIVRKNFTANEK